MALIPNRGPRGDADGSCSRPVGFASLLQNDANYRWLVEWVRRINPRRRPEAALRCIQEVAYFAAYQHTGRFADGAIENIALDIGRHLPPCSDGRSVKDRRERPSVARRVLHVVTSLEPIGGVTQAVRRWVSADSASRHTVLATNQSREMPVQVTEAVARNGGAVVLIPPQAPILNKAAELRAFAASGADVVVVHHYPHDVVPTVAFARAGGPPVGIVNHSDQMFWLGSSVADATINLRSGGVPVTAARREPKHNLLLRLPLEDAERVDRTAARRGLGIPDDQVMLLSIGRGNKYRPDGRMNFFRTGSSILARNPAAHLHVVGVTPEEAAPHLPGGRHDRFHFHGSRTDPSLFQAAADVYIEGFPFGSQTALLDSALVGVPAVGAYDPPCQLLVCQDDALEGLLDTPRDEEDYVDRVSLLVRDPGFRRGLGEQFRERLLATHTGDGWLGSLRAAYAELEQLAHAPGPLAVSPRWDSRADAGLARWCDSLGFLQTDDGDRGDRLTQLASQVAYRLRQNGCYRDSWRLLTSALRQGGPPGPLLKALAKTPLSWARQTISLS